MEILARRNNIYAIIQILLYKAVFGYKMRSYHYDVSESKKLQSSQIQQTFSTRSVLECCYICGLTDYCASGSFDATSTTCFLSTLTSVGMTAYTDDHTGWISFSRNEWLLVFRAPKGIGGDLYLSYVHGTDVTTNNIDCININSTTCNQNYRHPIIDLWGSAGFEKVRVAFYKNQVQDAYIDFNASGSTLMTWFRKERIIESSWTNAATDSYNIFSIEGWEARRFYINLYHGRCIADRLYSVVVTAHVLGCVYDDQLTFPQFIYANGTGSGIPEVGIGTDLADFMAMFVK